jgi:hypothetical protein
VRFVEVARPLTLTSDMMRRAIAAVIASAYGVITILILAYPVDNLLNSPMSVTVTAGIALAAATAVVLRQKASGLYGKTYVALTIGLACWFAGEFIYTYESVFAGSSFSTISIAEGPWLALYAFFGYYIFKTYRFFGYAVKRNHLLIVLAGVSLLMAVTTSSILNSLGSAVENDPLLLVRLLYPIGDAVLLAPSVLLLLTLRHGLLTYTPWLFISIGLVMIAAADIAFSNMSLLQITDLGVITFPLYNAGNLAFAGALLWYSRFGIYDQGKALNSFQEGNR